MEPAQLFCVIGLVVSLVVALTAKPVANFLAPKGESVFAIPRMLLSMMWMFFVPLVAWVAAAIFGCVLVLMK